MIPICKLEVHLFTSDSVSSEGFSSSNQPDLVPKSSDLAHVSFDLDCPREEEPIFRSFLASLGL